MIFEMPQNICPVCCLKSRSKCFHYAHLYTHINKHTIGSFSQKDIDLCKIYYDKRNKVKKDSYHRNKKKGTPCNICGYKMIKEKDSIHLVANHTREELLLHGYTGEFIDSQIKKRQQKLDYLKEAELKNPRHKHILANYTPSLQFFEQAIDEAFDEYHEYDEYDEEDNDAELSEESTADLPVDVANVTHVAPFDASVGIRVGTPFNQLISKQFALPFSRQITHTDAMPDAKRVALTGGIPVPKQHTVPPLIHISDVGRWSIPVPHLIHIDDVFGSNVGRRPIPIPSLYPVAVINGSS
jgi:hypothetical protein